MTKIDIWGPATWRFMHTLAHNLNIDSTPTQISIVFGFIYRICCLLPCQDCVNHAKSFLNQLHPGAINTVDRLKHFIYIFHNYVNKRLRSPVFSYADTVNLYENINMNHFYSIVNHWLNTFNTDGNFLLMSENQSRKILKRDIYTFIQNNVKVVDDKPILF
jgi:hypothetical protein